MNQDQLLSIIRLILPAVLPLLISKGWVPASAGADITSAVVALSSAMWAWWAHSDSSKIKAVTALPDVSKIVVSSAAPAHSAAAAAASDSAQPKVTKG